MLINHNYEQRYQITTCLHFLHLTSHLHEHRVTGHVPSEPRFCSLCSTTLEALIPCTNSPWTPTLNFSTSPLIKHNVPRNSKSGSQTLTTTIPTPFTGLKNLFPRMISVCFLSGLIKLA